MKFEYRDNPLATRVHLNKEDEFNLYLAIIREEMSEILFSVYFKTKDIIKDIDSYDKDNIIPDLTSIVNYSQTGIDYIYSEDDEGKAFLDERFEDYKNILLNDVHIGDCTCVPATCMKCLVEDMLGINTCIMEKHAQSAIYGFFYKNKDASIDDAIKHFSQTPSKFNIEAALREHKRKLEEQNNETV